VTVGAFLWLELLAAGVLAGWTLVRFPHLGPRSVTWSLVAFVGGQCLPGFGLALLQPVLRLPDGVVVGLVGIVLTTLYVMLLTAAWLMRAIASSIGGPRGGHRVRASARSRA
jgi:hypothetical protein